MSANVHFFTLAKVANYFCAYKSGKLSKKNAKKLTKPSNMHLLLFYLCFAKQSILDIVDALNSRIDNEQMQKDNILDNIAYEILHKSTRSVVVHLKRENVVLKRCCLEGVNSQELKRNIIPYAKEMKHNNICTTYLSFMQRHNCIVYLWKVSEFVFTNLMATLRTLSEEQRIQACIDLTEALIYLEAKGIVMQGQYLKHLGMTHKRQRPTVVTEMTLVEWYKDLKAEQTKFSSLCQTQNTIEKVNTTQKTTDADRNNTSLHEQRQKQSQEVDAMHLAPHIYNTQCNSLVQSAYSKQISYTKKINKHRNAESTNLPNNKDDTKKQKNIQDNTKSNYRCAKYMRNDAYTKHNNIDKQADSTFFLFKDHFVYKLIGIDNARYLTTKMNGKEIDSSNYRLSWLRHSQNLSFLLKTYDKDLHEATNTLLWEYDANFRPFRRIQLPYFYDYSYLINEADYIRLLSKYRKEIKKKEQNGDTHLLQRGHILNYCCHLRNQLYKNKRKYEYSNEGDKANDKPNVTRLIQQVT